MAPGRPFSLSPATPSSPPKPPLFGVPTLFLVRQSIPRQTQNHQLSYYYADTFHQPSLQRLCTKMVDQENINMSLGDAIDLNISKPCHNALGQSSPTKGLTDPEGPKDPLFEFSMSELANNLHNFEVYQPPKKNTNDDFMVFELSPDDLPLYGKAEAEQMLNSRPVDICFDQDEDCPPVVVTPGYPLAMIQYLFRTHVDPAFSPDQPLSNGAFYLGPWIDQVDLYPLRNVLKWFKERVECRVRLQKTLPGFKISPPTVDNLATYRRVMRSLGLPHESLEVRIAMQDIFDDFFQYLEAKEVPKSLKKRVTELQRAHPEALASNFHADHIPPLLEIFWKKAAFLEANRRQWIKAQKGIKVPATPTKKRVRNEEDWKVEMETPKRKALMVFKKRSEEESYL
ncbi:hypothetical protein BT63DRAFT_452749 [Microthyrium microscopicum]|uniref:Uncharacterized protein n=1 Tax=Microthyrium microscopicum TaxID=703497 RepID=A0A6A6UIZ2_9PEZI|nr:hypothetical protein BT63DRAFT_452749 [Microthyrium microscopicum]